nr:MAG TPA: hypothetical protein [Caudoviricetes sp.]
MSVHRFAIFATLTPSRACRLLTQTGTLSK